jgi:hypothetical protein
MKTILILVSILLSSCIKQQETPKPTPQNVVNICLTVCGKYGYTSTNIRYNESTNTYRCTCHDKKEITK